MNEKVVPRSMAPYRLALLPGDGTGREVMEEVKRLLSTSMIQEQFHWKPPRFPVAANTIWILVRSGRLALSNTAEINLMPL